MSEEIVVEQQNNTMEERGEMGQQVGGQAGAAVGGYFGGPLGAVVGNYIGEKLVSKIENKEEEEKEQKSEDDQQNSGKKKDGGGCSGGTNNIDEYKTSDGQCHATPETPKFKLEIEENDVPENWWDKLPDIDPRVYDAISMEQAAACVKYIFDGLPDVHELENQMEARGFRKICPRLKTKVPRTKIIRPKEIIYDTRISDFIKKDQTY